MATFGDLELPSEDSSDENYEDSEPERSGDEEELLGKRAVATTAAAEQRASAAESVRRWLEEDRQQIAHTPTVVKNDFMLRFHRRVPPRVGKRNAALPDLMRHVSVAVGRVRTDPPDDVGSFKKRCRAADQTTDLTDEAVTRALTAASGSRVTVTKNVRFAGQSYTVEEQMDVNSREYKTLMKRREAEAARVNSVQGIQSLVAGLVQGEKTINSVGKSAADWAGFKEKNQLEDEMRKNRQDGYLAKQEFLLTAQHAEHKQEVAARRRQAHATSMAQQRK